MVVPQLTPAALVSALTTSDVKWVTKPWGFEMVITLPSEFGECYVKLIEVFADRRTSLQSHPNGEEVVFIVAGEGTIDGVADTGRRPSPPHYIAPGARHRSVGPVTLLEVTTAGPNDIDRHEDDFGRVGEVGA